MATCPTCRTIDLRRLIDLYRYSHFNTEGRRNVPVGFPHHKTYAALRESATEGGCGSCKLFFAESNADPKYPNKPGIGEEDAVTLYIQSGDRGYRRFVADMERGQVVITGLQVSYHLGYLSGSLLVSLGVTQGRGERYLMRLLTWDYSQVHVGPIQGDGISYTKTLDLWVDGGE